MSLFDGIFTGKSHSGLSQEDFDSFLRSQHLDDEEFKKFESNLKTQYPKLKDIEFVPQNVQRGAKWYKISGRVKLTPREAFVGDFFERSKVIYVSRLKSVILHEAGHIMDEKFFTNSRLIILSQLLFYGFLLIALFLALRNLQFFAVSLCGIAAVLIMLGIKAYGDREKRANQFVQKYLSDEDEAKWRETYVEDKYFFIEYASEQQIKEFRRRELRDKFLLILLCVFVVFV